MVFYNELGFISYSLWLLIFIPSHFMTLKALYFPYCNRILWDENQKISLLLLLAPHQYHFVTLSEFQLPHLHFTSHSLLNPCFQLSCKCATVTSESCSVCSCFLSTASNFSIKFQSCYPSCFQNSFPHYQFNAFSLFSLMLSKLCRSSCSKRSPLCAYLFPNASL